MTMRGGCKPRLVEFHAQDLKEQGCLRQRHDLKFLKIDYLRLMPLSEESAFHQQEVSESLRQLKLMAKELSNPVMAIAKEFNLPSNLDKGEIYNIRSGESLSNIAIISRLVEMILALNL